MIAVALTLSALFSALEGVAPSREAAIDSLAVKPDAVLVSTMDSVNWRGRDAVVTAMERSTPPRIDLLIRVAREDERVATRRTAIRSLGRVGPAGTCDTLLSMVGTGSDAVVLDAVRGRSDCQAAMIAPFVADVDRDVRRRAFLAVAELDPDASVDTAVRLLDDPDHGVREAASSFLATRGPEVVPAIGVALPDLEGVGRTTALRLLGVLHTDESAALLGRALASRAWQDRRAAAVGLGRIRDPAHLAALKSRAKIETHPLVKETLTEAIVQIEKPTK